VGCYCLNTARLFAGEEPLSVRALARFGPTGVDLSLTAQLQFPGGVLALIDCSFEQPFRCSYELVGTRGSIEVPDAYLPPEHSIARVKVDGSTRELRFESPNQYAAMVDAFSASVCAGGRLVEPSENGLAQMQALDSVLSQARLS
jgi:predicted dehydrogenase